jgi:hypothetical protein
MNTIQTSLAALQEGSALAANFPYVAPIAGLLLHALTTRGCKCNSVPLIVCVLTSASPGSEAIQRRVRTNDAQGRPGREHNSQHMRKVQSKGGRSPS